MEGRRDDAISTCYLNCKCVSDIKFELQIDCHVRNWATLLQHSKLNVWCFPICCVWVCQVDSSPAGQDRVELCWRRQLGASPYSSAVNNTYATSRNASRLRIERFQFRQNPHTHRLSGLLYRNHSTFSRPQAYYTNACEVTNQNENSRY